MRRCSPPCPCPEENFGVRITRSDIKADIQEVSDREARAPDERVHYLRGTLGIPILDSYPILPVHYSTEDVAGHGTGDRTGWGRVMDQGMEIALWAGMALLALVWGNLHLWHTRRVLKRLRQDVATQTTRMTPSAAADPRSATVS
jgi:hypothetical protein